MVVAALCCAGPVLAADAPQATAKPASTQKPAQVQSQKTTAEGRKTTGQAQKTTTQAQKTPQMQPPKQPLDLRIPDITELYTPEEIEAMFAGTRDDGLEVVEVRGARVPITPDVWGGLAAPVWALLHPAQSWRIIAPVPPDRIHAVDVRPDAQPQPRDPFRP